MQQRELQELTQQRAFEQQQEDIEKQKEFIRRFKAGQRSKEGQGPREAAEPAAQERPDDRGGRRRREKINLSLDTDQRAGDQVLRVRELSKSFDDKRLWERRRLDVTRGERIGIIGPNGSGKTTLLRVLLGEEDADAGDVRWGANLNIGYYDQRLDDFDPENTVLEETRGEPLATSRTRCCATCWPRCCSAATTSTSRWACSPAASGRACAGRSSCSTSPTCCCSTSRPTTSTSPRARRWRTRWRTSPARSCASATTATSSTRRVKRLLVLQPPSVVSFGGTYSAWVREAGSRRSSATRREACRARNRKPRRRARRQTRREGEGQPLQASVRPAVAARAGAADHATRKSTWPSASSGSATPEQFKDATRGRKLQEEYESLSAKLEALEAEYFAREQ